MKSVDELLKKYWRGASGQAEEESLHGHFSEQVEKSLESDFFKYLQKKRQEGMNAPGFEQEILSQIQAKQSVKTIQIRRYKWQVAAAVLLLVASSLFLVMNNQEQAIPETDQVVMIDSYEDPQLAYEETKKALLLLSSKLNKGNAYTAEIVKFNQAQESLMTEN